MKVICDRGALVDLMNVCSGVIVSRTPKPVLTCVKMSAGDGMLTLSATDQEIAVKVTTPKVEINEPGEALVAADKLLQIVRESNDPTLTIESESDSSVTIRGEDARYKVFGYPVGDFPSLPEAGGEPDFTIDSAGLHKLIAQTVFATARENSRYAINGVLMERENNKLMVVATDGRRLALAKGTCQAAQEGNRTAIVPTKALHMIQRLFTEEDQSVSVKVAENQVIFAADDAMLASNLVEGNFPPYRDVVPKDGDKKATIHTDAFASAVRRAALLTNEESKGVRLEFKGDGLTLSSRAPETGEAEISIEVAKYDGDEIAIGFNPAFILDALKVADTEEVGLEFKAPNKPGVLRTGPDFLYVIMPVNLS